MAPSLENRQAAYEEFRQALSNVGNSIPVQPLWLFKFNGFPSTDAIDKYNVKENISYQSYYSKLQQQSGCIFAQSVTIPGEDTETTREKVEGSGYIGGLIGSGRGTPPELEVVFLDTNCSFTDFVLRPWILAIARAGLKDDKIKTSATCYQLMKTAGGLVTRSETTFNGLCPTKIDSQQYDYQKETIIHRTISFAYTNYKMEPGSSGGSSGGSSSSSKPSNFNPNGPNWLNNTPGFNPAGANVSLPTFNPAGPSWANK